MNLVRSETTYTVSLSAAEIDIILSGLLHRRIVYEKENAKVSKEVQDIAASLERELTRMRTTF